MSRENKKQEMELEFRNRLKRERRDVSLYHNRENSSHIISSGNSLTLTLKPTEAGDYLNLAIVTGPGPSEYECVVDFPAYFVFQLTANGSFVVVHEKRRMRMKLPIVHPFWQLKVAVQRYQMPSHITGGAYISVSDAGEWNDNAFTIPGMSESMSKS